MESAMLPKLKAILPWGLLSLAISAAVVLIFVASGRELTSLEAVLFQLFILLTGLAGSFIIGKQSAAESAFELVKPHARSAFRRVWSLYESLSRLAATVESLRLEGDEPRTAGDALSIVEVLVTEQLATAGHALEDWRDIVPDEVDDLMKRLTEAQSDKQRGDAHGHAA